MNSKRNRQRLFAAVAGGALIAAVACAAPPPSANPGDTTDDVIAKLGKPQGSMTRGRLTTYYYDRGMVYFIEGRVQSATLMTPEEAARLRREQDKADQLKREQLAAQQQATADGQEELKDHRADAAFLARPATERLAYWENFHKRHPDIDVSTELANAKAAAESDGGKEQRPDELKILRARVAAIRARLGELEADYAAARANWKRDEIAAERTKLMTELDAALQGDRPPDNAATNNAASPP